MDELDSFSARTMIHQINKNLKEARRWILLFRRGKGWKALGYANLKECVKAEWGYSLSWFYRQAQAQQVIENIAARGILPMGDLSGRALQQLAKVGADIQTEVYLAAEAAIDGTPTESAITHAIEAFHEEVLTGTIEDGDGEQVRVADLRAAGVAHRILEAKLRNTERLTSGSKREYITKNVPVTIEEVLTRTNETMLVIRVPGFVKVGVIDAHLSLWTEPLAEPVPVAVEST